MSEICLSTGLKCIRCNPGACDHRGTKPNINGDLISRKSLLKFFRRYQKELSGECYKREYNLLDTIIKGIENEPCAYDVDNVLYQLRENLSVCNQFLYSLPNRDSIESYVKEEYLKGKIQSYNRAIEIVREGYINE